MIQGATYSLDTSEDITENIPILRENKTDAKIPEKFSSARSLLRHSGTWIGDDLEDCLAEVYSTRGEAGF